MDAVFSCVRQQYLRKEIYFNVKCLKQWTWKLTEDRGWPSVEENYMICDDARERKKKVVVKEIVEL